MNLEAYLKRPGALNLTALSRSIGISKSRLSQLRSRSDWPPELALKAERVTGGEIDASDLSPVIADARSTSPHRESAG